MTGQDTVVPEGFHDFFWGYYRQLVRDVIFAGGHEDEAEDAVCAAMVGVLNGWNKIENPLAYARKAAIRHLLKTRQRGQPRIIARIIAWGGARREGDVDNGLVFWEQTEWVTLMLHSLPPAQQEVLACVMDGFSVREIAALLGKTEAAVRQSLCKARKSLVKALEDTRVEGR